MSRGGRRSKKNKGTDSFPVTGPPSQSQSQAQAPSAPARLSDPVDSTMANPARLFIASVGNPAPYYNTLHSAGHHLVDSISASSLLSPSHTLYKSSTQMNVSGANVVRAYKSFLASLHPAERSAARLVILHDELELALGQLKLRTSGSFKGHNGLKSVSASLGGKNDFARIGIGIGRPESRERDAVSDYVLRRMTGTEKMKVTEKAEVAVRLLERLANGQT